MTDITATPLALAAAEARRRTAAKAVDAAIADGRVIPADDGMMLDDGITDRVVPRPEYALGNPSLFRSSFTSRRDWFDRLWDFIMGERAPVTPSHQGGRDADQQ
jgi:hypothetical protein